MDYLLKMQHFRVQEIVLRGLAFIEVLDIKEDAESWISLTNGKGTHLGLWHTHPELTPTPSDIDMADYNNVIKNATLNSGLIYIIIGTQELKIWYGIKPCQLIPVGTISLDKL